MRRQHKKTSFLKSYDRLEFLLTQWVKNPAFVAMTLITAVVWFDPWPRIAGAAKKKKKSHGLFT